MENILQGTKTITVAQHTILKALLESNNRVEFYLKLNEFTGSKSALLMSQISSSSGVVGGTAWAINNAYDLGLPGYPEKGVEFFSQAIARDDLKSLEYNSTTNLYSVPSDQAMLLNAHRLWKEGPAGSSADLGFAFPGNGMIALNFLSAGDRNSAVPYLSYAMITVPILGPLGLGEIFWESFDSRLNSGKSIPEMLERNPGSRLELRNDGAVTVVIGRDGKTLGAFMDSQLDTLPLQVISDARALVAETQADAYRLWNSIGAGTAQEAGLVPVLDVMGNVTGFTEAANTPATSVRDPADSNYMIDTFADGSRHRYPATTAADGSILVLGNGIETWILPANDGSMIAIGRSTDTGTINTRYLNADGSVQREYFYRPRMN